MPWTLLYMGEIVSLCILLHSCSLQFNLLQSPIQWNVDFALVDERENNRVREESHELGILILKLRLGDDEISFETYIHMEGEENTKLELSIDELVDATLGINYAQGFDLNVDFHLINVDNVALHTVKLSNAKRHASLLSNFLLNNSLHFGVNDILSFQKLVRNLDKTIVANLGRQHQRSLNSYFKSS
jgi:hypothetical protein